ncbi:MAG: hypothetical protein ABIQ16_26225 [Polyangiaceae bacterium]
MKTKSKSKPRQTRALAKVPTPTPPRFGADWLANLEKMLSTADVLDGAELASRDLAWTLCDGFEAAAEIGAERASIVRHALREVRWALSEGDGATAEAAE